MGRAIIREILLLAAACALAASGAEAYLRAFDPQNLMTPAYTERMGITAWLPNVHIREKTPYFDARYTTNNLGFRGKTYAREKPKGVYRILSLGGSFTFGTGVNDGQTYSQLLEDRLNAGSKGPRYEVVNFGWGGTPMNFQELLYRKLGRLYSPDLLLIHVHFITVDRLAEGDVSRREETTGSAAQAKTAGLRQWLRRVPGYNFLCENSHLWALKRKNIAEQINKGGAPQAFDLPKPDAARQEDLQRRYVETFDGLVESACAGGAKVLVIKDQEALWPFPIIDAYMKKKAKRSSCFRVLDLDIKAEHVFSPQERHWNAAGHAFVADKVFHAL